MKSNCPHYYTLTPKDVYIKKTVGCIKDDCFTLTYFICIAGDWIKRRCIFEFCSQHFSLQNYFTLHYTLH